MNIDSGKYTMFTVGNLAITSFKQAPRRPDIDVVNIPLRVLMEKVERRDVEFSKPLIAHIRDRFVSMTTDEKREYYKCGDDFLISEQIPSWQDAGQTDNEGASNSLFEPDALLNSKVALWRGDINRLELDVLVVSEYARWRISAHEAGPLVLGELDTLQDVVLAGKIAVTSGYYLPAKYVYHIPDFKGGEWWREMLYHIQMYTKVLESLKEQGQRTLAFTVVPYYEETMMETTRKWLQENHTHVDKIVFCIGFPTDEWHDQVKKIIHNAFPVSPTAVPKCGQR